MNTIQTIQVEAVNYASRTLETILLTNQKQQQKLIYLYNYEGLHFRLFENIFEVSNFFSSQPDKVLNEYVDERLVDDFLEKYQFVS